jgi:hypothetical protein
MEPLFVDNDFGRGFDSRRLHHNCFNNLHKFCLFVVRYRTMSPWRSTSIDGIAGTVTPDESNCAQIRLLRARPYGGEML